MTSNSTIFATPFNLYYAFVKLSHARVITDSYFPIFYIKFIYI